VTPVSSHGKTYNKKVADKENALEKSRQEQLVSDYIQNLNAQTRTPEPRAFLKIITGKEEPCEQIDSFFRDHHIEFTSHDGSYYLTKEQALVLATDSNCADFCQMMTTQTLTRLSLSYLCSLSYDRTTLPEVYKKTHGYLYDEHQSYQGKVDIERSLKLGNQAQNTINKTLKDETQRVRDLTLNFVLGESIVYLNNAISEKKQSMTQTMVRNIGQQPAAAPAPASSAPKQPRNNQTFFVPAQPTVLPSIQALFKAKEAPLPSEPIKLGLLMRCGIPFQEFVSCISSEMVQEIRKIADVETAVYPEGMQTILFVDDALMKKIHQCLRDNPDFQPNASSEVRVNP
jgi:hypothetical protein